jgi:hypothetical protein
MKAPADKRCFCRKEGTLQCKYCGYYFCTDHIAPSLHDCLGIDWITSKSKKEITQEERLEWSRKTLPELVKFWEVPSATAKRHVGGVLAKKTQELLDALDERLAKGEITEETYKELEAKYSARLGEITGKPITKRNPVVSEAAIHERIAGARHKELIGYIRMVLAIVMAGAGGYLYSVKEVVLNSYSYEVTKPYETLGIVFIIVGLVWALYEGLSIGTQRRIQKAEEYMLSP